MTIKKVLSGSAIVVIALMASCSQIPEGNSSLFGNYDQAAMLTNIGGSVLQPGINNLSSSAAAANNAISAFTLDPTHNTLTAAQSAWQTLAHDWATAAPFDFGPMSDNLISVNIDHWPVSYTKIETAITAQSNAANVGADTKGLKALEYLLFDVNGNAAVLARYTDGGAANRKAFLNSVAADLAVQATKLNDSWTGGYLNAFTSAKGNDVSSSASQLVNAMTLYLDNIKNAKIGNPIGKGVKVNDNQPHPDKIEYTITEESLAVMKANVLALKAAFDGDSGQGLDDLLNYVKAQKNAQNLSVVVDSQFDDVVNKINFITPPFATAVTGQGQQVEDVFNSLKTLITYFKVDVANNLGITITFSDTDGD